MSRLRVFVVLCLAAASSAAPRPPALADLADRAQSLPGEFAAGALLRIAAAPNVIDPAWRRELIESAFALAAGAQEPFARRTWADSHRSMLDKAFAQGLDACTLRCRAVHAMLALDRKRAREMFAEIPPPRIPRLSCEDALVYDVSVFYATLGEVAGEAFNAKEVADEEPLHLLQRYVPDLTSPVQAGPIARMLAAEPLKPAQLEVLANTFASVLKQFSGDDRSFSSTISSESDAAAIENLASACAKQQISPVPLLDAWRSYLVRHLSGSRCADTTGTETAGMSFGMVAGRASTEPAYSGPLGAVRYFNQNMRIGSLPPISDDEVQPAKTEGKAAALACESPQCRQLSDTFKQLVLGPTGLSLTEEQRAGAEWGGKVKEYLAALADWKSDNDLDAYFYWKSGLYSQLFNVLPNGPDRDAVLSALLAWLQQSDYQRDHRVEWFYPVNALIIRAFADPVGMKTTVRELRNAADPAISLYARLEQVLPRPLDRAVGLL